MAFRPTLCCGATTSERSHGEKGENSKGQFTGDKRTLCGDGPGIVQELCESRGGRPVLSVLTSLLVSVDVKIYCTVLRHWSQLVPNMSHDI